MDMRQEGRGCGRAAGANIQTQSFVQSMNETFRNALELYPSMGKVDLAAAIRDYDRERLACEPDYAKFPEMRGLLERHLGEREGFREASGLDETAAAFQFSWHWFLSRRVNSRHLSRYDLIAPRGCTNVFFPHGKDGVTVSDNRDDWPRVEYREKIPKFRVPPPARTSKVSFGQGGASSACLLDEDPQCCFPCDPFELMPKECYDDIHAAVEFLTRYREFYGPGNQIWCDSKLNAVAVEKTTCRVAFRWPTVNGAVCVTACSYVDPELNAYKKERTRKAMAIKGETEANSPDWNYFEGSDARHRRLIALTDAEAKHGATLWGAFDCVADTKVSFPARVCLAGEKTFPDREPNANWSLTEYAAVITGPKRRALYRSMQDLVHPKPIYSYKPKLVLGKGVKMRPEWQADVDKGLCELAPEETV